MNRLNPLYIILLFGTIVFISFYLLKEESKIYNKKISSINELEVKAKSFNEFKSSWDNKKYVHNTLNSILNSSTFKREKVLRVDTSNSVKVKLISSNQRLLNSFLNKVLNKKFLIKKLSLEKTYISIEIGIKK